MLKTSLLFKKFTKFTGRLTENSRLKMNAKLFECKYCFYVNAYI